MRQFCRKIINNIERIIEDPGYAILMMMASMRGFFYIIYYRLFKRNIRIGFPFYAFAPVRIIGPGSVSIGRGCFVSKNAFRGLTIFTHSIDSVVIIGNKCLLGGLTVRCRKQVVIGDRTMTAVSIVQDSFFVNPEKIRALETKKLIPESKGILIGTKVWLGPDSLVLSGSIVRDETVLAAGTWCHNFDINGYSLVSGNPAKKPMPIEKILKLKGMS